MHATAPGLAADETSLGSRRLRRPQPHPPTAGGSLGPGGGCRLGVRVSGFPLADIGRFLRYERSGRPAMEPHFRAGCVEGGGWLPPEWRRLARLVELVTFCEMLTQEGLPDAAAAELVGLIRATVDSRLLTASRS